MFRFTHTIRMDWMLPGLAPTGKRVEITLVVIVRFREGKLAHEHIYWDQASVLVQLGLLEAGMLPVAGVEAARKALNPSLRSNVLSRRADGAVKRWARQEVRASRGVEVKGLNLELARCALSV